MQQQQQRMVAACKPHAVRRAALPLPGPSLRRAFLCSPARAGAAAPRTAVRRRCQEEKQQQSGDGGGGGEKKKQEKRTFLSLEEAGLVEMSGLSTHERFLCRLTISSLNLLRVISEQEGVAIEEALVKLTIHFEITLEHISLSLSRNLIHQILDLEGI